MRGRGIAAELVGHGGRRGGRPRSRATGGHGGDTVPPDPAAARMRRAFGLSAVGLLVGLADGRGNTAAVVDLVTVLLRPGTDLRGVLAATGSGTGLSTPA